MRYDAIVLAGGRATRLGGTPKPGVVVGSATLLDHALAACADARRAIVVGPPDAVGPVPPGVVVTREDPAFGGPVAGIAAGLDALGAADASDPAHTPEHVLLLAVDVPGARDAATAVLRAAALHPQADGVHLVARGRAQWLTGVYRRTALTGALNTLDVHGAPVRRLVAALDLVEVPDDVGASDDVDTWEDVSRLAARHARGDRPEEATT